MLAFPAEVGFFEIISENFMQTDGFPRQVLERLASQYPIILHGICMSIAGSDPLDFAYLARLKQLAQRVGARYCSDHLCWTTWRGQHTFDLLPVPLTEAALRHVTERVRMVQDYLEMPLALENPSTYLEYSGATMTEWEFLGRLAEEADCGLVLDINNIYVSGYNHGFDPLDYLRAIPVDRIMHHHVAGHEQRQAWLHDTHSQATCDEVWELVEYCMSLTGGRSTSVEWDNKTPPFERMLEEMRRLAACRPRPLPGPAARPVAPSTPIEVRAAAEDLATAQAALYAYMTAPQKPADDFSWIRPTEQLPPASRAGIYRRQFRYKMAEYMQALFPACHRLLGHAVFSALARDYITSRPPLNYQVMRIRDAFPDYVRARSDMPFHDFLFDLARLELGLADAYHAWRDHEETRSLLHPSVTLLLCHHAIGAFYNGRAEPNLEPTRAYIVCYADEGYSRFKLVHRGLYRVLRLLSRGVDLERAARHVAGETGATRWIEAVQALPLLRSSTAPSDPRPPRQQSPGLLSRVACRLRGHRHDRC